MARRLEVLANLAFLVLCVVGIVLGVQAMARPAAVPASGPAPPLRTPPPVYQPGERLTIEGIDFKAANRTLLLVLRSTCRYCTESMPFYKTLMTVRGSKRDARIVVVTPETVDVGTGYLATHGVELDAVVSTPLSGIKVRGTPTAILVNNAGTVEKVWQGRLDSKGELEVVAALR